MGLGLIWLGQILKLSKKNTLSMGMRQIEFTSSVMFGSLSNDNVCLQITDREGLQNVSFDTALETGSGGSSYLRKRTQHVLVRSWQTNMRLMPSQTSPDLEWQEAHSVTGCPSLSTWWPLSGCPTPGSPRTPRTSWRVWPTPPCVRSVIS